MTSTILYLANALAMGGYKHEPYRNHITLVSSFLFRAMSIFSLVITLIGCVPERHVPGGPYCFVLYGDYSFRPVRLIGLSQSEAKDALDNGRPIGVAFFASNGLLERTRECRKRKCSDWLVYNYDAEGKLVEKQTKSAGTSEFNVSSCPESPPQSMVKLPKEQE